METVKSLAQIGAGLMVFAAFIAIAGACALGKQWIVDNSPDWAYPVTKSLLGSEEFIKVGLDDYECKQLGDEFERLVEKGETKAYRLLEEARNGCKRDYRKLRDEVRRQIGEVLLSSVDCARAEATMSAAIRERDAPSALVVGIVAYDRCPSEYKAYLSRLQ